MILKEIGVTVHSDTIAQKKYLRKIQLKREEMINLGKRFGLTSEKTIICSQQLDDLLNEYHHRFQVETLKGKPSIVKEISFIIYKCRKPIMIKEKMKKYNILKVI